MPGETGETGGAGEARDADGPPATPAWYGAFAAAVEAGEQRYLDCESCGAAALPPRTICPACGETTLTERPLSGRGTVESFTEIHVTIPEFHGTTPYTVVLAGFEEGVRLTGQLRGAESVAVGDAVALGAETLDDGRAILTFEPEPEPEPASEAESESESTDG